MLRKVLLIALIFASLVLAYASTRSGGFRQERAVVVAAPAARIFPHLDDLRKWPAWSPCSPPDADLRETYGGPTNGPGAFVEWEGAGRMEIVAANPPVSMRVRLEMKRPFAATSEAEFTLVPDGASTRVVWAMRGAHPLVARVIGVFVDLDRMIGDQLADGLVKLKQVAERDAAAPVGN